MSWAALSPVHARENSATGSGFCTLICLCGGPKAAFCVNESVWPCRLAGFLCASACCLCARFSFYSSFWVWPESRWCKQYKHATHPRLAPRVGGCTAAQQLLPCSRCVDETPCVGDSWLFASSASLPRSRIPTTCHGGGVEEQMQQRRSLLKCAEFVDIVLLTFTLMSWCEWSDGNVRLANLCLLQITFRLSPFACFASCAWLYLPQCSSLEAISSWGVKLANHGLPQIIDRTSFLMLACLISSMMTILVFTFSFIHIFTIEEEKFNYI